MPEPQPLAGIGQRPPTPGVLGTVPIVLGPNQPADRPYRGGAGIASFRHRPWDASDPFTPEDFVASTTTVHGSTTVGLTLLGPELTLKDAVARDPRTFLGDDHVDQWGADPMLLVKLLHTGERLFVHLHPSDDFAAEHLHEPRGKTEAWVVVEVEEGIDGYALVGFDRSVPAEEALSWFDRQDADAMLAAMHRVPLAAGSTLFVPAGVPHAIGPGITLVELQQPTDLSILLEYSGYNGLSREDASLGLGPEAAIAALDLRRRDPDDIAALLAGHGGPWQDTERLFPQAADRYFRAERIRIDGSTRLDAAYSVLIAVDGAFTIEHRGGSLPFRAGETVLVPFGADEVDVVGRGTVLRALPPMPDGGSDLPVRTG